MKEEYKKYLKIGKSIQQTLIKQLDRQVPPVFSIETLSKESMMELFLLGGTVSEITIGKGKIRVMWHESKMIILDMDINNA